MKNFILLWLFIPAVFFSSFINFSVYKNGSFIFNTSLNLEEEDFYSAYFKIDFLYDDEGFYIGDLSKTLIILDFTQPGFSIVRNKKLIDHPKFLSEIHSFSILVDNYIFVLESLDLFMKINIEFFDFYYYLNTTDFSNSGVGVVFGKKIKIGSFFGTEKSYTLIFDFSDKIDIVLSEDGISLYFLLSNLVMKLPLKTGNIQVSSDFFDVFNDSSFYFYFPLMKGLFVTVKNDSFGISIRSLF